jgi:hypothetical protein
LKDHTPFEDTLTTGHSSPTLLNRIQEWSVKLLPSLLAPTLLDARSLKRTSAGFATRSFHPENFLTSKTCATLTSKHALMTVWHGWELLLALPLPLHQLNRLQTKPQIPRKQVHQALHPLQLQSPTPPKDEPPPANKPTQMSSSAKIAHLPVATVSEAQFSHTKLRRKIAFSRRNVAYVLRNMSQDRIWHGFNVFAGFICGASGAGILRCQESAHYMIMTVVISGFLG